MPVMDEFKEEREALKHGTPKQKFTYFMDYYKWHAIVAVAVICFIASMIYNAATRKETAFLAIMINAYEAVSPQEHAQSFAEYAGIDTKKYDIMFDSSVRMDGTSMDQDTIAASQKLMVYIAAGEIDLFMSDSDTIEQYAYNDSFFDLRDILSPEQIEKYEPYFFYMDLSVFQILEAAQDDPDFDYSTVPERPDPKNPQAMEQPVPIGLYLDNADSLNEIYYFLGGESAMAIPLTSKHLDTVVKYIDFILE